MEEQELELTEQVNIEDSGEQVDAKEIPSKEQAQEEKRDKRNLTMLLFRNTIAMLVPTLLIFFAIFIFTQKYPVVYRVSTHPVLHMEEMKEWYQKRCYNVKYECTDLKYTGYDYLVNGKVAGAYYYAFEGNQCVFVLVRTKHPKPVIEHRTVYGKMMDNSIGMNPMLETFSQKVNMDPETLKTVVYPLYISEIDNPRLEKFLMWMLIIIPYIITALMLVFTVAWFIHPHMHPSARVMSNFGDRKLVYQEIKSQLKHRMILHHDNYYFTDEYLIIRNLFSTDFVRIDFIRYISKHVIKRMGSKKPIYRLTMSNPEKMFFEKDFTSEEAADEIMATLIQLNPHIDNRTMHVFDLVDEEAEEKTEVQSENKLEETTEVQSENHLEEATEDNPETISEDTIE